MPPVALEDVVARLDAVAAALGGPAADDLLASIHELLRTVAAVDSAATAIGERLWQLALAATERYVRGPRPDPVLAEAVAGLQRLAIASSQRGERVTQLRELEAELEPQIQVAQNGPYLVTNARAVRDWLGAEFDLAPQLALCRCGASRSKPFCDGSHVTSGFTGEKSPSRVPDRHDSYQGIELTVFDNRGICQHSGYCTDLLSTVFRVDAEPFVAPSGGRMDEIIRAVRACPSGALSYALDGVEQRAQVDHQNRREPSIEVSKDGPYRVVGAIPLVDHDGRTVERAQGSSLEHYALCRCGQSQNKPFCSGMHWYVEFRDPVPGPGRVPTVFEWAGGLPALRRMAGLLYERRVTADPSLAGAFASATADRPERLAVWLGEVFGGPKLYSERYGDERGVFGAGDGGTLTEEQRGRWVSHLMAAAGEAGLPGDAEFHAVLLSYVEWASRRAATGADAADEPIPSWSWENAAGPPPAPADAPGAGAAGAAGDPTLPGLDEPVSFAAHIKPMFRERDRRSMQFVFDLWSAEDVRAQAQPILARLRDGSMPCDGAWPPEKIAVFERWIVSGMSD